MGSAGFDGGTIVAEQPAPATRRITAVRAESAIRASITADDNRERGVIAPSGSLGFFLSEELCKSEEPRASARGYYFAFGIFRASGARRLVLLFALRTEHESVGAEFAGADGHQRERHAEEDDVLVERSRLHPLHAAGQGEPDEQKRAEERADAREQPEDQQRADEDFRERNRRQIAAG